MECSCSCDYYDDYEPIKCVRTQSPIARKRHVCCECGESIAIGERYERVTGHSDSEWCTWITCTPCSRIREDFGCLAFGILRAELCECLGFDYVTGEDYR